MYRSGSTWHYMVASHLVETKRSGKRLGFINTEQKFRKYDRSFFRFRGWQTLKMHTAQDCFAAALAGHRAIGIYSYRDLRDVVFSAMQKRNSTFEAEAAGLPQLIETDRFWRMQPHTLIQSYDDIVNKGAECVREIAAHMEVPLNPGEDESIAADYSLEENRRRVEEASRRLGARVGKGSRVIDARTLLHYNHIYDGRSGKWRELATREQIAHLASVCGMWLIERGYEKDLNWAREQLGNEPDVRGAELHATSYSHNPYRS